MIETEPRFAGFQAHVAVDVDVLSATAVQPGIGLPFCENATDPVIEGDTVTEIVCAD